MLGPEETWRTVQRAGDRSARGPVLRGLARAGYFARAAMYAVIAALALSVALGAGGRTTDTRGALATLARAPAGQALVVVLGIALAGLALWFAVETIAGERRAGAAAAAARLGNAATAFGYAALSVVAFRLATGGGAGPTGNRAARTWTGRALALPAGRWIVLAGAALVVFLGARQVWRGVRRRFLADLDLASMDAPLRRWAGPLGAAGLAAQGAVFVVVGLFFAWAAFRNAPREATGFDGALAAIARQPWGSALLAVVAVGLLAYSAYSLVEGRCRRLRS